LPPGYRQITVSGEWGNLVWPSGLRKPQTHVDAAIVTQYLLCPRYSLIQTGMWGALVHLVGVRHIGLGGFWGASGQSRKSVICEENSFLAFVRFGGLFALVGRGGVGGGAGALCGSFSGVIRCCMSQYGWSGWIGHSNQPTSSGFPLVNSKQVVPFSACSLCLFVEGSLWGKNS